MKTVRRGLGVSPVRAAARKKLRQAASKQKLSDLVPTSWLDSLLTGPNAALPEVRVGKWNCRDIEALLRGVQDRIRAAESSPQGAAK
jgi:hypothetical protein